MALNIKNDEAHRMARELAEARGSTLTDAVTSALEAALEARVESTEPDVLLAEIGEIQRFVADLPDCDPRDPDEILGYDETGLPA